MDTPPPERTISASPRRVRSTSWVGRSMSSFIRSRRFVPPARNLACGFAATERAAASASVARSYLNGRIAVLLAHARQFNGVGEPPCPRGLLARVDLLDRGHDPRIGPAAADVAAHPLSNFIVRELRRRRRHILGDMTGVAATGLVEQ